MNTQELQKLANKLRLEAVRMVYEGKDGHPGPALSIADIVATLYFDAMNVDPKNPEWEDRDRFVLSKGHTAPGLYSGENRDCSRYRGAGETSRSHAWAVEASIGDKNTAGTANGYLGY